MTPDRRFNQRRRQSNSETVEGEWRDLLDRSRAEDSILALERSKRFALEGDKRTCKMWYTWDRSPLEDANNES
jgi:hypothetical protein